jgi:hypothetical protein
VTIRQARKILARAADYEDVGLPVPYSPVGVRRALAACERHPTKAERWFRELKQGLDPFVLAGFRFEAEIKNLAADLALSTAKVGFALAQAGYLEGYDKVARGAVTKFVEVTDQEE